MEERKIYVVTYCNGIMDEYIDIIDCAFKSKEDAEAYVERKNLLKDMVSDDLYSKISQALSDKYEEIDAKYYEPYDYDTLKEGMSEEDYYTECNDWDEKYKQKYVEDTFGIPYEAYEAKDEDNYYSIEETIFYGD